METLYRTEKCYGSGIRDVYKVIAYEVLTLCNSDILDTIAQIPYISAQTRETLQSLSDELDREGYIEDIPEETFYPVIKAVLDEIKSNTGYSIKYALWLAEYDAVKTLYNDGEDDGIIAYEPGPIILSDLGYDGKLFGYEKIPEGGKNNGKKFEEMTPAEKAAFYENEAEYIREDDPDGASEYDLLADFYREKATSR